jgi:hypothetical protein
MPPLNHASLKKSRAIHYFLDSPCVLLEVTFYMWSAHLRTHPPKTPRKAKIAMGIKIIPR